MVDSPVLRFPRSLQRAPNIDISRIKGNVTDEQKQLEVNVLFYFISTREKSYGADIGQRLKIVEMNVWNKDGRAAYGETIFEIEVEKG
jgi:acyl-coenzyme A thioesterase 13